MRYLDLNNKNNYDKILRYIFKECDEISFYFPLFDEKTKDVPELSEDYEKYMREKGTFLQELFNNGAVQEKSNVYQGRKLGLEAQIIRVKLYPRLIEKIKKHHIYDWVWWNGLPEDLCFFSKKVCRFGSVTHEEMFYINNPKNEQELLNQLEK